MTTTRSKLTSSGVFGPPEGGALQGVVPALHVSSSSNGQMMTRSGTGCVREFACANYNKEFPPILRLRGGGEEDGGDGDDTEQAGPSSPVVCPQPRPGPRCSKGKERGGHGGSRKEKDWMEKRRIQSPSSEEEIEEKEEGETEKDEEYIPESPLKITQVSKEVCENVRRKLRSSSKDIASTTRDMPRIVAVTTLEGPNRIRVPSPGMKRAKEEEEERMEVVVEVESGEDVDDETRPSSRASSSTRDGESPSDRIGPKVKKVRRKQGRPAKDPSHEGQFTAVKLRQRAKEREAEKIEEKEVEISDPKTKATSARAEAVERQALKIMDDLRELPDPELTERALRAIEVIKKVASSSRNMSGAFVGLLWKTSEELTALNLTFTSRLRRRGEGTVDGVREELDRLRSELSIMRTEHAIMGGENRRLREQVADLRARMVKGETLTPPPLSHVTPASGKGRRRERKGVKTIISDTSSSDDVEMEEAMGRELSPEARKEGIRARKEVREDLLRGTLPPAVRPAILGRTRVLDEERRGEETPPTTTRKPASPAPGPQTGLSREDMVRLIRDTVLQLIPQLGGAGTQPGDGRGGARMQPSPKEDTAPTQSISQSKEEAGDGKTKKRKRKGKKGKGGSTSQQGGTTPKGTNSLPPTQKKVPGNQGPTPLPRKKSSATPSLDRTKASGGEANKSQGPGETWALVTKKGKKTHEEEKRKLEATTLKNGAAAPKKKGGGG